MASEAPSRQKLENNSLLENPHPDCDCPHHQPPAIPRVPSNRSSVLGELVVNRIQNISTSSGVVQSQLFDLDNFNSHSPAKENPNHRSVKARSPQDCRQRLIASSPSHLNRPKSHKGILAAPFEATDGRPGKTLPSMSSCPAHSVPSHRREI